MLERIDRYILKQRIGAGGQATVYLGEDPNLGRTVAVKVMNQLVSSEPEYVGRLTTEARMAAGLSHPNIATVHDFKIEGDVACIVMEYVPNSLDRELKVSSPMSPSRVVDIGIQVCDALAYAHSRGLVHRDIKPHNILLSEDGTPKITDFGIARATELSSASALGTPMYMSPEQCQGDASPDIRSDIYSLGVTLYEMLAGQAPFQGNVPQLYSKHISEPMPDFPSGVSVSPNFISIVRKCMEKDPGSRYQTAAELASALAALSGRTLPSEGGGVASTARFDRVDKTLTLKPSFAGRRYPLSRIIAGLALILVLILGAVILPTVIGTFRDSAVSSGEKVAVVGAGPALSTQIKIPVPVAPESGYVSVEILFQPLKDNAAIVEVIVPQEKEADLTHVSRVRVGTSDIVEGSDAKVVLRRLRKEDEPAEVGTVTSFRVFDITLTGVKDSANTSGAIRFDVKKDWIGDNGIDAGDVSLFRVAGGLEKLPTRQLGEAVGAEDQMYLRFEADTPGFSIFVVGVKPDAPQAAPSAPVPVQSNESVSTPGTAAVYFPDAALGAAVKVTLGKSPEYKLTAGDLAGLAALTSFTANEQAIEDLTGLEYAVNLVKLELNGNNISDISPISSLTSLSNLSLQGNQISNVSPLSSLTSLHTIVLNNNQISDIGPLSGLTNLTTLELNLNRIINIGSLSSLTKLNRLLLGDNKISDIRPLSALTNSTVIYLFRNEVSDVSPLKQLSSLEMLDLSANYITDVSPLTSLTKLTHLYLVENNIADFKPLRSLVNLTSFAPAGAIPTGMSGPTFPDAGLAAAISGALGKDPGDKITAADLAGLSSLNAIGRSIEDLTGLEYAVNLTRLDLTENRVFDISPLAGLSSLITLDLQYNQISDITPLASLIKLEDLDLVANQISDISPLASLTNLKTIHLFNNKVIDLSPLKSLAGLETLDLSANNITDVSPLASLTKLTHLYLVENNIADFKPLRSLVNLTSFAPAGAIPTGMSGPTVPDAALAAAIRGSLDKDPGYKLTTDDLAVLSLLNAEDWAIKDLTGLEYAVNLVKLDLRGNNISNLSPLSLLTNLTTLQLQRNQIRDINPLSSLTNLDKLILYNNQISNISSLSTLTSLTSLQLGGNNISDISPLSQLTNLESLSLHNNQISDITPLASLTKLENLELAKNRITDVSPLSSLTSLRSLMIHENSVTNIGPLSSLTNLTTIWLNHNNITSISPLSSLTYLTHIDIPGNQINDISPLLKLTGLRSLDLRENQIIDISSLASLTKLEWLELSNNQISNVSSLSLLVKLETLDLAKNRITDASPLSSLTNLKTINLEGNPIATGTATPAEPDKSYTSVKFPDPNLDAKIRQALGKGPDVALTTSDTSGITELNASSSGIDDLNGIELLTNLTKLELASNVISDIGPLGQLTNLEFLSLYNNQVSDIGPLKSLVELKTLELAKNRITDSGPLVALTSLGHLGISGNQISDLTPLSPLTNLNVLDLYANNVIDISPLSSLTNLIVLSLDNNSISDITPLKSLTSLTSLFIANNKITNYSPLESLDGLRTLRR